MSVTQYFTIDFICEYYMLLYPFDTQKCNGIIETKTNSKYFIELVPTLLDYHGRLDMMKYVIHQNVSWIKVMNILSNMYYLNSS